LRKDLPALRGQNMEIVETGSPHILAYIRVSEGNRLIVLANFSEETQHVDGNKLRTTGMGRFFEDVIEGTQYCTSEPVEVLPYQILWLQRV